MLRNTTVNMFVVAMLLCLASCEESKAPKHHDEGTLESDCTGCDLDDPTAEHNDEFTNRVALDAVSGQGSTVLVLTYSKAQDAQGPRVAELRLSLSPDLTFVSAKAGSALTEAGKELISQVEEDGVIRLVALSGSSVSEIGSGVLATVQVTRSGSGLSTAELLLDRPLFAPSQANDGLLVDGKVTF